jgi:uncharacterized protein YciW
MATPDTINTMAGIAEDSPVATLRLQKPDLVAFAQGSDQALLEPADPGSFSLLERHAVGYRIGLLTGFEPVAKRHEARLRELGESNDLLASLADLSTTESLSPRLAAIIAHTDQVTLSPGAATQADIAALANAGLTPTEIVSLGQLIGFLAYQIRAIAVARALGETA